ncbi:MAG TPA: hypothetical protein VF432_33220 [Thermoanaerobaculia bacterium]
MAVIEAASAAIRNLSVLRATSSLEGMALKKTLLAVFILLLVAPVHGQLKHRTLRGEVMLRNNRGDLYNLVVLVDSYAAGKKRDGKVDHIFGIRSDEPFGIVSERIMDAQVTVEAGQVAVYSKADDRAFVLAVPGHEEVAWLAPATDVRTFLGHSMVANEGVFDAMLAEPRQGGLTSNFTQSTDPGDPMGGSAGNCAAGGSGSSFCGISCRMGSSLSCEVTCTDGRYACCSCDSVNGARCRCRLYGT